MTTLEKEKIPVLPLVDPSVPSTPSHSHKNTVRRGVLTIASVLALFAIARSTYPREFGFNVPGCLRSPNRLDVPDEVSRTALPDLGIPKNIQRHWGQYSPYYTAGKYVGPPDGCVIDQVNILQRHGARYPDHDDDYNKAVKRLQGAKKLTEDLKFVKDYEYTLGTDLLLAFGAVQSNEAGHVAYERYFPLVSGGLPFVRASGMQRVVDTAGNWSLGFLSSHLHNSSPPSHQEPDAPLPIQIISEEQNNTLNNKCPNALSENYYSDQWLHEFAPPVIKKLHKMAKGAHLEDEDIRRLIGVCIFETIADASEEMFNPRTERQRKSPRSPFCDLFELQEWKDWEYWGDIEKYYKTGYGNALGPIQGVGYVNELIARLTNTPVSDRTQHNYTLEFPLDRSIYADFTHENLMIAVYSAMGLFNVSKHLDPKKLPRDENREWLASHMVPFSARMVVERLSCSAEYAQDQSDSLSGSETFVRIFVNDELQPLGFCHHHHDLLSYWERKHGLCTLDNFVASQAYASRSGDGDFNKCYN